MSSNEEDYNDGENSQQGFHGSKKRRIQRACDICRRKKIRCDGVQMPGNRCSNCIAYSFECTYVEAAKKRGPPKGYVESLETRVEKLEKLLRRLCPDDKVYNELNKTLEKDNWALDPPPANPSALVQNPTGQLKPSPLESVTCAIRAAGNKTAPTPPQPEDDDDDSTLILADNLKRLTVDPHEYRFFGKSSGAMLIHTALELKNEYSGVESDSKMPVLGRQRAEFWTLRPWESRINAKKPAPVYQFPEPDLAEHLIDLYFEYVNLYLPLLHRPTFEKSVLDGLQHTNQSFASVYLLVCAVGSRFSADPRVRLDGVESYHSCGWKWFDQVQVVKKSLLSPPSLYDLQFYCLSVQFLQGSSAPQSCWTMVGIGIRLAQDVGAHRRKIHTRPVTAEDELWKRAFWVLVCMDRSVSASLGRPCAIQDEDFDVDLPIDCDDEYWDDSDPEKQFKQPSNKASLVSAFILQIKLNEVLAFSLRTIYSINKSKILLGFVGQQWEQHIVAELDSSLNKWVDSVPDHLRWDPNREDVKFFNQSVSLYAAYYHIQILIHRPFIPSPSRPSPLSFPSLAICTNAARSCSHVVDVQRKRNKMPPPQIQMATFTSGIVLLLSIWGGRRSGLSTDPNREMADVHKCMQVLRTSEERWHSAGRLWDILYELASVGDLPLPQPSPPTTNKRERDSDTPVSAASSTPSITAPSPASNAPRNIAGSKRLNKDASLAGRTAQPAQGARPGPTPPQQSGSVQQPRPQQSIPILSTSLAPTSTPSSHQVAVQQVRAESSSSVGGIALPQAPAAELFTLPVYSDELGRLPLHGQVRFSAQPLPQQHPNQGNFWFGDPTGSGSVDMGGEPMSSTSTSSSSSLHRQPSLGHNSRPSTSHRQQQQQQASMFAPMSEMSSMAQGFNMDPASMGMMFDSMTPSLSTFGPHASFDMSGVEGTGGLESMTGMDPGFRSSVSMDGSHLHQQQHQQLPHAHSQHPAQHQQMQQGQQQGMNYGFVDSDTMAMWSAAPTGFELDEWGTYLTNVSELTHSHGQPQPSGSGMHLHHPGP